MWSDLFGLASLPMTNQLLGSHPNIPSDLSKQNRGDISPLVIGDGGAATIGVSILQVGAPLTC